MKRDPFFRNHLIRDAIHAALYAKMKRDPRVVVLGEGAGMKMRFDAQEILRDFPERVVTLPISENGNTDFAVGLALGGMVPVVDIITADFIYRAFDSIANTCAKMGEVGEARTMVIRAEFMTGGPTTGQ